MADRDPGKVSAKTDWREVARLVLTSREMDRIEEQELVPAKKVLYQFSARGHDMAQVCSASISKTVTPPAAITARGPCCSRSASRSPMPWARAWASLAAIPTGAISASSSITPIPAALTRCRCAAGSARNIRRRRAGRRRSNTNPRCWTKGRTMPSRWSLVATPAAPPADFGRR